MYIERKHYAKLKDVDNLKDALKYFKLAQEKLPLKVDKLSLKNSKSRKSYIDTHTQTLLMKTLMKNP